MSENKHTPGPWVIATSNSYRRVCRPDMTPVAEPVAQRSDGHPDIFFPNGGADGPDASLIAAAPDLLEALENVLEYFDIHCDEARQAIAKARGETQ